MIGGKMPLARPRFKLRTLMLWVGAAALASAWLRTVLYPAPPVAAVAGPTFHFGTMPQRVTGRHAYTVKNDGGKPLRLSFEQSTVGMYSVYAWVGGKKHILIRDGAVTVGPGQSVRIFMEWETRSNDGWFVKGANLATNDPDRPSVALNVVGTVTPAGGKR